MALDKIECLQGLGLFIDAKRHYRFELGYINQYIHHEKRSDQMNHILSASLFVRYKIFFP